MDAIIKVFFFTCFLVSCGNPKNNADVSVSQIGDMDSLKDSEESDLGAFAKGPFDVVLSEEIIELGDFPGALCNNGKPANYQVTLMGNKDGEPSPNWFFYFEGGGSCKDDLSCIDRWKTERYKMTPAKNYPKNGRPNLTKVKADPFFGHNSVQVHYCSSDGWGGSQEGDDGELTSPNLSVDGESGYRIHFRGKRIRQAVFDSLERKFSIESRAKNIVISGTSAGSLVVQYYLNRIADRFDPTVRVRGLLMDGFVPFMPFHDTYDSAKTLLEAQGHSIASINEVLKPAIFDENLYLQSIVTVNEIWGAFNRVDEEGWPGPDTCFEDLAGEGKASQVQCQLAEFVFDSAKAKNGKAYFREEVLIFRNIYDIGVGSASLGLFPDNNETSADQFKQFVERLTKLGNLAELEDKPDPLSVDLFWRANSDLADTMLAVLIRTSEVGILKAASLPKVSVFAPRLEMTQTSKNYSEPMRRKIPNHGVLDEKSNSTRTFKGHLIQAPGSNELGKARSMSEYLHGWANDDPDFAYSLVGLNLLQP